jgi:trimethylamine:corrinoid methyltransferase-like protein
MSNNLQLKLLTPEEIGNIYEKCVEFLSTKGVQVNHPQALNDLNKAGAQVDFSNKRVRFPRDIIETSLRTVPGEVLMAGQSEDRDFIMPHPNGLFYTRNNSGARTYVEPSTNNARNVVLADVAEWGQLGEVLDEINICAQPFPQDVPGETADIHAVKTLFENTTKHVFVQVYSFASIEYLFELALVMAGSKEALRKRPLVSMGPCSVPPFVFNDLHIEQIVQSCRYGVPMFLCPLPGAGATSPVTITGTVLQSGIEILAMLIMTQILQPGVPVIAFPIYLVVDMITGILSGATTEAVIGNAASLQFIKEAFHIPTHTWGFGTDSFIPDGQAMSESILSGLVAALAGGDLITGAGRLNASAVMSPVKLVTDNKLVKIVKRLKSGIKVDDDTLAWQEILNTEPGGHYLELAHTLKHCREALRAGLSVTQPRDTWLAEDGKDLHARMVEEYSEIKKKLHPVELPEEVKRELDRIVRTADKRLAR